MSDGERLRSGELVLLRRSERDALLLRITDGPQVVEGRGVVDLSPFIGQPAGTELTWAGARFRILRPSLADRVQQLHRKAQIVTPKDAQYLLFLTGIGPGSRVGEAGAGSGALTLVLAHAVGPTGHVYSFDRRADFLDVARRNVEALGFADRVEFRERDVAVSGIDLTDLDAVVLDLAEPWAVLESVRSALAIGGCVGTYTPTYNQLERTVLGLRTLGFEEIRSVELLERELHVGSGGTRPEFEMLGHTGFLTTGRKV